MGVIRRNTGILQSPSWAEAPKMVYTGDEAEGATKQVLIGPNDGSPNFAIRYFEVPAGQSSSLEHHLHDHGVVIIRGRARVQLGNEFSEAGYGDVVYVGSDEVHQFVNIGDGPLGFLCVIPAWAEKGIDESCLLPQQ